MSTMRRCVSLRCRLPLAMLVLAFMAVAFAPAAWSQTQQQPADQKSQQTVQPPPAAGGPAADSGVIALPKKEPSAEAPAPPAPPRPAFKNPEGAGNYSLQLNVPEVTVDVGVLLQKNGQFVPGLQPGNFRVYEDGVQQKIVGFRRIDAPITALLLCEFAAHGWPFRFDMLNAAWAFSQQLRPQDYVAMVTFDLKSHIMVDFTQDKTQIQQAINTLGLQAWSPAAFQETNVFDALYEALDRLDRIPGQKYIILIASGHDSFSKLTFDQIYKRVKEARNVTIYTISTGGLLRALTEGQPGMNAAMYDMTYLQADNQMKAFANSTGGMSFFPRFSGELPDIVRSINQAIRSKYELVYQPTNAKQDGTWRKLRVQLVDAEGKPLRLQDQKHHPLKYEIIARDGYRAKQEVE